MMRIGHIFHRYLDDRSQWVYDLLQGTKNCQHSIFSPLRAGHWPLDNGKIIWVPFSEMRSPKGFSGHVQYRINEWALHRKIYRASHNFDLFHSHFMFSGWPFRHAILASGKPWIISLYGFDYRALPNAEPIWKERYLWLFDHASGFLVEGPHGQQELSNMGCPNHKIHIQPLGCPCLSSFPENHPPRFTFLQISGLGAKKGIHVLLDAFKIIGTKYPQATLGLVALGTPSEEKALNDAISTHPCSQQITWIHGIPAGELENALLWGKFLIQASQYAEDGDHEGGSPYVIQQAMAKGIPVISTQHADIPQWVIDGHNGWLCEEKNVVKLAQSMENALNLNPPEYIQFKNLAHASVYMKDHIWAGKLLEENYSKFVPC